jgi:hypothetical protein
MVDFMILVVYTYNDSCMEKNLWKHLANFKVRMSKPWCLLRDFNKTLLLFYCKGEYVTHIW